MATSLTASFILKLEDKLSSGLAALSRRLERLAELSRKLSLAGLDGADRALDRVGASADRAGRKVAGIAASARQAAGALQRLSEQSILVNGAGTAFLPPGMGRAAMAAAIAGAAAAGGGHLSAVRDASFAGGASPLLLGGPGSGIPLLLNPAALRFSALAGAAGQFRAQLAQTATHARTLNGELRELGHGGMTALATGFGLFEPVREFASYENALRHIAITAETPVAELPRVIGELTRQYDTLATNSGQNSERIAEAANFLITTGIGRSAVDAMLPTVARAATAYNTPIGDSVQAIFSLRENLHVSDADLPGTVSAMAQAGKLGHFSFADMSRFLPDVAPMAAMAGMHGPEGARWLMAALETSRRNAGTSGEAETNLRDFISHLFGGDKRGLSHEFGRVGVNLNALLLDAEKRGIAAPQAVLDQVERMVQGKTPVEQSRVIGNLFHNLQSANFVRAYLNDRAYFREALDKLTHADNNTIFSDFFKAFDAPKVQLDLLSEELRQIVRRFGQGFAALVPPLAHGLHAVNTLFEMIDQRFPGLTDTVLKWGGGFLALITALGVLVPLLRIMRSGFMLAMGAIRLFTSALAVVGIGGGPIVWILGAIALAALLIYQHWDRLGPFFERVWDSVRDAIARWYNWVVSWIGGAMLPAIDRLQQAWAGVRDFFAGLWRDITAPLDALIEKIDRAIARIRELMGGGGQRDPATGIFRDPEVERRMDEMLRTPGAVPGAYRTTPEQRFGFPPLEVRVTVDGPGKVDAPKKLVPLDTGNMTARL